jgi:fumarate hydratase subunit alpha
MREIQASEIRQAVARLCLEANFEMGDDVLAALREAMAREESALGRDILGQLIENAGIARQERLPLCQDCGTALVFLEVGQDAHVAGGDLHAAIEEGVRQAYAEGHLRKSIVSQPFTARKNTGDNTPPVIHTEIVPGDRLSLTVMTKGGGAENMSRLAMLKPGDGKEGILGVVEAAIEEAGGKPCPPLIIGIGIGGTAEMAMLLAKKSLLRPVGQPSPDPEVAELERDALTHVNDLGVGPMGLGGRITALAVHAVAAPTHIASLPVAVNFQCHSARHRQAVL